jgi:hypothetical protein
MLKVSSKRGIALDKYLFFFSLLSLVSTACNAQSPSSVFVKTACDGKISSALLASLRDAISNSQKYRLMRTLADDGQMDIVLTINMHCTERNNSAAVATVFGKAKCLSTTNCHLAIDGSSLKSSLCDADVAAECGRTLFKLFDDYVSNPLKPPLTLR